MGNYIFTRSDSGPVQTGQAASAHKNILSFDPRSAARGASDSLVQNSTNQHSAGLLSSWKDISAYLNRGVRTVQRWEQSQGLPVHRIGIGNRAPVFALEPEIDAWLLKKAGKNPAEFGHAISRREHFSSRQRQLMKLVQEFRETALKLEEAVAAGGLDSDENIAEALLTIQKLVNTALAQGHSAVRGHKRNLLEAPPPEIKSAN